MTKTLTKSYDRLCYTKIAGGTIYITLKHTTRYDKKYRLTRKQKIARHKKRLVSFLRVTKKYIVELNLLDEAYDDNFRQIEKSKKGSKEHHKLVKVAVAIDTEANRVRDILGIKKIMEDEE